MLKKILLFLLFIPAGLYSQDIEYAKRLIDTLSSPRFKGRGYVNNGDRLAATFLAKEFEKAGLERFNLDFRQVFSIKINTLPSHADVRVNGKNLTPGTAFMVSASSWTIQGKYPIVSLKKRVFNNKRKFDKFRAQKLYDKFVMVDSKGVKRKDMNELLKKIRFDNFLNAKGVIFVRDTKLSWGISNAGSVKDHTVIDLLRDSIPDSPETVEVDIRNKFFDLYETQNVAGFITGLAKPDSFIVFCAHYDHLGQMGKDVFFPGANDNASGSAMVTDLARYFSQFTNRADYSLAFLLFTGEEAGLLGSEYYVNHPLFPLAKIKALINLDMVGTGSDGITVVNGDTMHAIYNKLVELNDTNQYVKTVKKRSQSCNSDHCPFFQKGVPAIFIYSQGSEFSEYHNIYDTADKLPLTKYNEIFRLLAAYVKSHNKF